MRVLRRGSHRRLFIGEFGGCSLNRGMRSHALCCLHTFFWERDTSNDGVLWQPRIANVPNYCDRWLTASIAASNCSSLLPAIPRAVATAWMVGRIPMP